ATSRVLDRRADGLSTALLLKSLESTPYAVLSRGVSGMRGQTLIVNLPGSQKAVDECFAVLEPVLAHAVKQLQGRIVEVKAEHVEMQQSAHCNVDEAVSTVLDSVTSLPAETVNCATASVLGRILASDVIAKEPLPPFRASVKDGYAVRARDGLVDAGLSTLSRLEMSCTAGPLRHPSQHRGPVPSGADAVVQVEDTKLIESSPDLTKELVIEVLKPPAEGQDIRPVGSDIALGAKVLDAGAKIGPCELGILASIGCSLVPVHKLPTVGVASTGNELMEPFGAGLGGAKIRDSNRTTLLAMLSSHGFPVVDLGIIPDKADCLVTAFEKAIKTCQVIVTTGGVSMGERDLVKQVLTADFNATLHFAQVRMKPGKPTSFATLSVANRHPVLFFGLPGNPVSAFVTANLYVIPACRRLGGWSTPQRSVFNVKLGQEIRLDPRPEYHRCTLQWPSGIDADVLPTAWSTGSQASSRLLSCQSASGLLILPARSDSLLSLPAGHVTQCMLLDCPYYPGIILNHGPNGSNIFSSLAAEVGRPLHSSSSRLRWPRRKVLHCPKPLEVAQSFSSQLTIGGSLIQRSSFFSNSASLASVVSSSSVSILRAGSCSAGWGRAVGVGAGVVLSNPVGGIAVALALRLTWMRMVTTAPSEMVARTTSSNFSSREPGSSRRHRVLFTLRRGLPSTLIRALSFTSPPSLSCSCCCFSCSMLVQSIEGTCISAKSRKNGGMDRIWQKPNYLMQLLRAPLTSAVIRLNSTKNSFNYAQVLLGTKTAKSKLASQIASAATHLAENSFMASRAKTAIRNPTRINTVAIFTKVLRPRPGASPSPDSPEATCCAEFGAKFSATGCCDSFQTCSTAELLSAAARMLGTSSSSLCSSHSAMAGRTGLNCKPPFKLELAPRVRRRFTIWRLGSAGIVGSIIIVLSVSNASSLLASSSSNRDDSRLGSTGSAATACRMKLLILAGSWSILLGRIGCSQSVTQPVSKSRRIRASNLVHQRPVLTVRRQQTPHGWLRRPLQQRRTAGGRWPRSCAALEWHLCQAACRMTKRPGWLLGAPAEAEEDDLTSLPLSELPAGAAGVNPLATTMAGGCGGGGTGAGAGATGGAGGAVAPFQNTPLAMESEMMENVALGFAWLSVSIKRKDESPLWLRQSFKARRMESFPILSSTVRTLGFSLAEALKAMQVETVIAQEVHRRIVQQSLTPQVLMPMAHSLAQFKQTVILAPLCVVPQQQVVPAGPFAQEHHTWPELAQTYLWTADKLFKQFGGLSRAASQQFAAINPHIMHSNRIRQLSHVGQRFGVLGQIANLNLQVPFVLVKPVGQGQGLLAEAGLAEHLPLGDSRIIKVTNATTGDW
uniref:MoCF_biosynth domain-containing protein n=1 Tax=Macrostomum lignano TaxID=282301 RepID=A0A1I8H4I1_9PLAT